MTTSPILDHAAAYTKPSSGLFRFRSNLGRLALCGLLGAFVWSGPLGNGACQAAVEPAKISADATWVMYVDFNALRSSMLGKELMDTVQKAQDEKTGGLLGINAPKALETIGSITLFGTAKGSKDDMENGSLVIQGTPDLKKILEALLIQQSVEKPENVAELKDYPFPAYGVQDKSPNAASGAQVIVAFPPEPAVFASKSKTHLMKSIEVFRGNAESLAKTPDAALNKLVKEAGDVPVFAATTTFPANAGSKATPSRVLQLASSGMMALGENGPNLAARLVLIATSEDTAGKMLKIVQGMTAMLSLAESSDKQLTEFLNSVQVEKDKQTVSLKLEYPSQRILQIIKNIKQVSQTKSGSLKVNQTNSETLKDGSSKKEEVKISVSVGSSGKESKPNEAPQSQEAGK